MAIGKQPRRIAEIVDLGSNLDRHTSSLPDLQSGFGADVVLALVVGLGWSSGSPLLHWAHQIGSNREGNGSRRVSMSRNFGYLFGFVQSAKY